MKLTLTINKEDYVADLSKPLDISLPLRHGDDNPNCYFAEPVKFETIVSGNFIGNVKQGGSVNFEKVTFTPHGNGTHTECYGHISADPLFINDTLQEFHFPAKLVSITPSTLDNGDRIVKLDQLKECIGDLDDIKALIIRTLPNSESKKNRKYSDSNPPYFEDNLLLWLNEKGILHFLTDLPSVDREKDEGKLLAHRAFWADNSKKRQKQCTITELIFVKDSIEDGVYLLNLQIASFELDSAPSKPVLYCLTKFF